MQIRKCEGKNTILGNLLATLILFSMKPVGQQPFSGAMNKD